MLEKKITEKQVRDKIGLLVDSVRPNFGTTNDGNTARVALSNKNHQFFSQILDIKE